jgi:hypothetical protein
MSDMPRKGLTYSNTKRSICWLLDNLTVKQAHKEKPYDWPGRLPS